MPLLLKRLLLWPVLFIFLVLLCLAALLFFLDPNDYRATIESKAKDSVGLNIKIDGDISWSLSPLGLDIQSVAIMDQEQKNFASFSQLLAQVDLGSIFQMSPQIHTLLLDGLNLDLKRDKDGNTNWDNLIAAKESSKTDAQKQASPEETAKDQPSSSSGLSFLVEKVRLSNTNILFSDEQADLNTALRNINLAIDNIAFNQAFPVDLDFAFELSEPLTKSSNSATFNLSISEGLSKIRIEELSIQSELLESDFVSTPTVATIDGDVAISTDEEQIVLSGLQFGFGPVISKTNLTIENYGTEVALSGDTKVNPFNLDDVFRLLGLPKLERSDPEAMTAISLETNISNPGGVFTFDELAVKLDQSTWKGSVSADPITQKVIARISGDEINVDRYLPLPAPAQDDSSAVSSETEADASAPDTPLLPVELLQTLNLDIQLDQQQLIVKEIPVQDIVVNLRAEDGLINLSKADAKVFEGKITNVVRIDARTEKVLWELVNGTEDIQPLKQLNTIDVLGWQLGGSGKFKTETKINAQGNSVASIKSSIKGLVNADVVDGSITGINLNQLACKGFAFANGKSVTKTDWPLETAFNNLQLQLGIDGSAIRSDKLLVENIGLSALGKGGANIDSQKLKYELDISPLGELGDEACEVNEKIKDIAIPVICEGSFSDEPSKLCELDEKKLRRIAEKFAKKELERKVDKEIDRAVENKLEKYLGEDAGAVGDLIKKGLKDLF